MSARVWWQRMAAVVGGVFGGVGEASAQQPAPYSGPPPMMPAAPVVTVPMVQAPPSVAPSLAPPTASWVAPPSVTAMPAIPAPAAAPADPPKFETVWNNGLFIQTTDKDFVVHVGGILHYDAVWYDASNALQFSPGGTGRFNDGVTPRRTRLWVDGTVYKHFDFSLGFEFANGAGPVGTAGGADANPLNTVFTPGLIDAWVTATDVPVLGNVRVGNQKEWFSLEQLNSARYLEFIERSYLFDASQVTAYNNGRNPGISAFRTWAGDRVWTGVGVYKNTSTPYQFGSGDGEYAVTGRVGWLPVYSPDQQSFWYVGGAMSHRDPVDDQVRVRVRTEARGAPVPLTNMIADTGFVTAESQTLYNLQTAAVAGPVTVQGEYLANLVNGVQPAPGVNAGTRVFQGFYAETLVFLTGESRTWNPKTMTFHRVIPKQNFGYEDGRWGGGWGAWELAARYTYLTVSDGPVRGGRLNNVTVGLNWYWNPNMKAQFNYDYVYRDDGPNPLARGQVHSLGTRFALDF